MLCHGLWNSTPIAVAYNRELLGLEARLSTSRFERESRSLGFFVSDVAEGAPVLSGYVRRPMRASIGAAVSLTWRMGLCRIRALASNPGSACGAQSDQRQHSVQRRCRDFHAQRHERDPPFRSMPGSTRVRRRALSRSRLPTGVRPVHGRFKFVYLLPGRWVWAKRPLGRRFLRRPTRLEEPDAHRGDALDAQWKSREAKPSSGSRAQSSRRSAIR